MPGDANAPADCAHEKDLQMQAFPKAAEGIRTLDLLHGKQSVRSPIAADFPCKPRGFSGGSIVLRFPGFHREITGVWAPNGYPSQRSSG
jgi:hypothetical protein